MDVDGVLNSTDWFRRRGPAADGVLLDHAIDPVAMARLNRVWKATLCSVVVSSTWRLSYERCNQLAHDLRRLGLCASVVGRTPNLRGQQVVDRQLVPSIRAVVDGAVLENVVTRKAVRGDEIQAWLDENQVDEFVILDDDADMVHLGHRLVRTDFLVGLTEQDVDRCIEMLLGESPGVDCSRAEGDAATPGTYSKSAPGHAAASPSARERQGRRL